MNNDYEIVVVDRYYESQATDIIYYGFQNDICSRYYYYHLEATMRKQQLETLKYEFFKLQFNYFVRHPRYFLLGVVDKISDVLVTLCVWKFPESSSFLQKNLSRGGLFKFIGTNMAQLGNYLKIGLTGMKKFKRVTRTIDFAEGEVLNMNCPRYKLTMLATHPDYQGRGLGSWIVEYSLDYIDEDFAEICEKYKYSEQISHCDYTNCDITTPLIVVDSSTVKNSRFYSSRFGFETFATIYFSDEMLDTYTNEDVSTINDVKYMHIDVMVKNRPCLKHTKIVI